MESKIGMKYFIKENEEVIGLLQELYAGIKLPEEQSLHEISEEDEIRLLPENFYNNTPSHITNVREFMFDFVPGAHSKFSDFYAECVFVGENPFLNVSRVTSKYYVAGIDSESDSDLTVDDISKISLNEIPQEVNSEYNNTFEITVDGKTYNAHFDSGVASISIDVPINNTLSVQVDDKHKVVPVNLPLSIVNMRSLKSVRDSKLSECDKLVIRHITQKALGAVEISLTDNEYEFLLAYMQELRDMPETETNTANPTWPTKPGFMS